MKRICVFVPFPASRHKSTGRTTAKLTIGRAERPLMAFVLVLSYSRYSFLRFYLNASLANLIRGHVEAFSVLGGGVRKILFDNMKSVVLERRADAIRFHPTLLELAAHYRFEPRPVAPARGNEKGRVERHIRFARESFFRARRFRDLDDLNDQADEWCRTRAAERPCPEDPQRTVAEVFAEERAHLIELPDNPFPCEERVEVQVGKTPYIRFDANDYSIPHRYVGRTLVVSATLNTVRILDAGAVLATHRRSFDRGQQIEDPAHIEELERHKRLAREHRATDRLHHAAPSAKALFAAAAQRNHHLGVLARGLIELLNAHGPVALERAIAAALQSDAAYLGGVRHFIDQQRKESDKPPPLALALPDDRRLPHDPSLLPIGLHRRQRHFLLAQPPMHLSDALKLRELAKHQVERRLDPPIWVLLDAVAPHLHIAHRDVEEELAAACLLAQRLVRALAQSGQLHL